MIHSNDTDSSILIRDYEGLRPLAEGFVGGAINLLTIIGPPGVGKSHEVTRMLRNKLHIYIASHASPFALYRNLYRARHLPVVLDDVDSLMSNRATVPLLKSLCELDAEREICWTTTHPMIGENDGQMPARFRTTSPVCLLMNSWGPSNANLDAIRDRAVSVRFDPTFDQIHQRAGDWFCDQDVYKYIGDNHCLGRKLSFRTYLKGQSLKYCLPHQWQDRVLEMMGVDERSRAFVRILDDERYDSEEERAQAFVAGGLGHRATYFRWKQRFEQRYGRTSRKNAPNRKRLPPPDAASA